MSELPRTKTWYSALQRMKESPSAKSRLSSLSSSVLSDSEIMMNQDKSTFSALKPEQTGPILTQRELTKKLMQTTPGLFQGFSLPPKIAKNIFTVDQSDFEMIKRTERSNAIAGTLLALLSLVLAVLQNDLSNTNSEGMAVHLIRTIVGGLSLGLLCTVFFRYHLQLQELRLFQTVHQGTTILYILTKRAFWLEILVCLMFSPPLLNISFETSDWLHADYTLDDVLTMIMFIRLYHVLLLVKAISRFHSIKALHLGHMHGADIGMKFILHAYKDQEAVKFSACVLLGVCAILSFLLTVGERPYNTDFDTHYTGMWLMSVSITSTGYGDYTIYTFVGRAVVCGCGFLGAYIVSLYITVCAQVLDLSNRQKDANFVLNQRWLHDQRVRKLKDIAALMIQMRFRVYLRRRGIVRPWPILDHFSFMARLQRVVRRFMLLRMLHPEAKTPDDRFFLNHFHSHLSDSVVALRRKVISVRFTIGSMSRITQKIEKNLSMAMQARENSSMILSFGERLFCPDRILDTESDALMRKLSLSKSSYHESKQIVDTYNRAVAYTRSRYRPTNLSIVTKRGFLQPRVDGKAEPFTALQEPTWAGEDDDDVDEHPLLRIIEEPLTALHATNPCLKHSRTMQTRDRDMVNSIPKVAVTEDRFKADRRPGAKFVRGWDKWLHRGKTNISQLSNDSELFVRRGQKKETVMPLKFDLPDAVHDPKQLRKRNLALLKPS